MLLNYVKLINKILSILVNKFDHVEGMKHFMGALEVILPSLSLSLLSFHQILALQLFVRKNLLEIQDKEDECRKKTCHYESLLWKGHHGLTGTKKKILLLLKIQDMLNFVVDNTRVLGHQLRGS